jgi:hypothetical protein
MPAARSFTSSSNVDRLAKEASPGHFRRRALQVALWTVLWLGVMDVGVGFLVAPDRPWAPHIQSFTRFFEYGRSIEGKLANAIGSQSGQPSSIVSAGWIDPVQWRDLPAAPLPGSDLLVAVYGQSFAFNAANEMAVLDGHVTLRKIGGPAAPFSHSFAAWRADATLRKADVVVVGILASSLMYADSISALSWTFENPAPYTYPRFKVRDGVLGEIAPVIETEAEFRRAFAKRGPTWKAFVEQLRANDQGFDRFAFGEGPWTFDGSVLMRMARRGWVANRQIYVDASQNGVAIALLDRLRAGVHASGDRLIVLLLQDHSDRSLEKELAPALETAGIRFISSERLFSSRDPANFQADGHFTEAANLQVAQALREVVRAGK